MNYDPDPDVRSDPLYPDVTVSLVGKNGNVFNLLGIVKRTMNEEGIGDKWKEFFQEATAGDYDHFLQTCMKWFNVE